MRKLVVAIFLAAAVAPLHAAGPWPLPLFSSDPKVVLEAADQHPASAESGIVILDFQDAIRFLSGGRMQATQRTVYRLLNETGVAKLAKAAAPTGRPYMQSSAAWGSGRRNWPLCWEF
jgi:hypothetical protein